MSLTKQSYCFLHKKKIGIEPVSYKNAGGWAVVVGCIADKKRFILVMERMNLNIFD
jgi:hypothetical protein